MVIAFMNTNTSSSCARCRPLAFPRKPLRPPYLVRLDSVRSMRTQVKRGIVPSAVIISLVVAPKLLVYCCRSGRW